MADYIVVDVEADGPCPGLYSIVSFGAVSVDDPNNVFYGNCRPIEGNVGYLPDALAVSGISREYHSVFPHASETMFEFKNWLNQFKRPVFVSDNPAFDWQFINYYFHRFSDGNPFGFSARRIGDFYAGINRDWNDHNSWKKMRKTKHTHNPVDDARGNAEALQTLIEFAREAVG